LGINVVWGPGVVERVDNFPLRSPFRKDGSGGNSEEKSDAKKDFHVEEY